MKRTTSIILLSGIILPVIWPNLAAHDAAADAEARAKLSKALTLHASFDKGLDADYARGDKVCYIQQGSKLITARPNADVKLAADAGRFGGALYFPKKGTTRPSFKDGGVVGYNSKNWSASVAAWMRIDPDRDLEPGYCDPIQIIGDDSKKGYIFLEWSKDDKPRFFRYAMRPLFHIWNPKNQQWADIPADKKPMVEVARAPFSREQWTHVAFTLENINDKAKPPVGRLYLNGKLQGSIEKWDMSFDWDPAKVLLVLGANYVGYMDDLAVFDRALTDQEVDVVYQLKNGIRELYSSGQSKETIGTIERLDPRFDMLIPKDAQLEKIADGYIWTEGAVWYKHERCLLFSDIPNNVVIKWEPGKGTSEFLKPSGYTGAKPRGGKPGDEPGSNGLAVDSQGRLCLCEHGDRRVTRIEKDGKKTVLADNYMGKKLNSPNDLALHPNGDVYFTDPPYGLAKGDKRELDFTGVFRISGKDGAVSLVSKSLNPNGIALSPDLKKLYVTNGGSWWVFPVHEDGSTGEGKPFVSPKEWKLTPAKGGGIDGMKCDTEGNIFATGPGGVCVIAKDGTLLGRLLTGDRTANLCFGGEDGRTLFVCVNHRVGMIRTTTKGIGW